jgi:hypothetical protein
VAGLGRRQRLQTKRVLNERRSDDGAMRATQQHTYPR